MSEKYRRITIGRGRNAQDEEVLVIGGVPAEEPGEGIFVLDNDKREIREGLDILAFMPKNSTQAEIIKKLRELGQGAHIKPGY